MVCTSCNGVSAISEGQGQKSNFMCNGPNAISAKHSAYEQAVPWGSDEKSHRATSERIHPSQLALLALIGELSRMLEKLKKEDFAHEREVRHML